MKIEKKKGYEKASFDPIGSSDDDGWLPEESRFEGRVVGFI